MKFVLSAPRSKSTLPYVVLSCVLGAFLAGTSLQAQGMGPKTLLDPASSAAQGQVSTKGSATDTVSKDGVVVTFKGDSSPFPGVAIKPSDGATWDLGAWGHVEAKVTNTSAKPVNLNLRVDNEGPSAESPWSASNLTILPNETKTIKTYFGYNYGKSGAKFSSNAVTQLLFFVPKAEEDQTIRLETIQAAGINDEKPEASGAANTVLVGVIPPKGVILDAEKGINLIGQYTGAGGGKGAVAADGKSVQIDLAGGATDAVTLKPATGLWNLNEAVEVKVKVKNTGSTPVKVKARVECTTGPSDTISTTDAIAPGAEAEIVIPFEPLVTWKGLTDPVQMDPNAKKKNWDTPGTSTSYRANRTTGVTILGDAGSAGSVQVTSVLADLPELHLPEWLGKKPPVDGDWVKTFDQNFDGGELDHSIWNVYMWGNYDKKAHVTKDNTNVKDGKLIISIDKKTGREMDSTYGKETDYSMGYADTFGKWTQRYGYFETRVKLSKAPATWPAFWLMPDRGLKEAHNTAPHGGSHSVVGNRSYTEGTGMEFDIMEHLAIWGIHRYDFALHFDGYGAAHKALGSNINYVQADKDGYLVAGLLWTPGLAVFYGNGKEIGRWESPRISDVQEYILLNHCTEGWDFEPIDDKQLPADFTVDYVRAWQRKDLASPDDGPKPNKGLLDAFHEEDPNAETPGSPSKPQGQ